VTIAQTMRDVSPELMDILGTASTLPMGTDGAADDGAIGVRVPVRAAGRIYGGTLEVFRNMIAQYALGLGSRTIRRPRRFRSPGQGSQDGRGSGSGAP